MNVQNANTLGKTIGIAKWTMIARIVDVGISHPWKAKRFLMIEIIGYIFGIGFLIWLVIVLALWLIVNYWGDR